MTTSSTLVAEVELATIRVKPSNNPRHVIPDNDDGLVASIKKHGVLVPILVTHDMQLVAGYRRFTAAKKAALDTIVVRILPKDTDTDLVALLENLNRTNLHPIDEALAIQALKLHGHTDKNITELTGIPASNITARLRLTRIDATIHPWCVAMDLTLQSLNLIAGLAPTTQIAIANHFKTTKPPIDIAELRNIVYQSSLWLSNAPFDIKRADLVPEAGACTTCPYNTKLGQIDAFDNDSQNCCTNESCYELKIRAHRQELLAIPNTQLATNPTMKKIATDYHHKSFIPISPTDAAKLPPDTTKLLVDNVHRSSDIRLYVAKDQLSPNERKKLDPNHHAKHEPNPQNKEQKSRLAKMRQVQAHFDLLLAHFADIHTNQTAQPETKAIYAFLEKHAEYAPTAYHSVFGIPDTKNASDTFIKKVTQLEPLHAAALAIILAEGRCQHSWSAKLHEGQQALADALKIAEPPSPPKPEKKKAKKKK